MESPNATAAAGSKIRVTVQQPALPLYRIPVFSELARQPGIDLTVHYGNIAGGPPNVDHAGFKAHYTPLREWRMLGMSFMWHSPQQRYATKATTDVLILSWNIHYLSLVPALLRARINGVRTILWGHGYSKQEAGWRSWPRRKIAQLADALLFYNHTAARRYLDAGWDPKRIFVALNAIDQTPIQAARQHWLDRPDELAAFRQQHGLTPGPVVLFVSRFDPANRLDLLLHAAVQLRQRFPDLRIVIIGKGEPEGQRLRNLVEQLGLKDHVLFPGAIYDEMQLAPWFLCSDVFCYPANIGLSILHAFGYGLPVVTSNRLDTQNPEIEALRNGQNGLLYDCGNDQSLASALQELLTDERRRKEMSAEADRTIHEYFSMARMVDGMETAILESVGNGKEILSKVVDEVVIRRRGI